MSNQRILMSNTEENAELEDELTEDLIRKLKELIQTCKASFTEKDNIIFKKLHTLDDKRDRCAE